MGGLITGAVAVVIAAAVPAGCTAADSMIEGVASVIDGDTIEIHGTRIRLEGIDAPESQQPCTRLDGTRWRCGQQAALALSDRIGRSPVACDLSGEDRYGRAIAICRQAGVDLSAWLVSNGWAVAYRRFSTAYVRDEEAAEAAGAGI